MATNLPYVMTFAEACEYFTNEILPMVQEQYEQDGVPDWPARGEAWCNWTDSLCKDQRDQRLAICQLVTPALQRLTFTLQH